MKAAVFYGPQNIKWETVSKPKIKPNWVLLKVKATGICGSDIHIYKGEKHFPTESRVERGLYVPGHEFSGEIHKAPQEYDNLQDGCRVGVEPIISCQKCRWCRMGDYNLCENVRFVGFHYAGAMAEYCAVPAKNCLILPSEVSFQAAAMLDCIAVAVHATNKAEISSGNSVAILGAGTIGLLTLQIALLEGAKEVYISGTHDFQLEKAKNLGAKSAINARKESVAEKVLASTDREGVDKVIETVGGSADVFSDAVAISRKRATIITLGDFVRPIPMDMTRFLRKELVLRSAWGYSYHRHRKEFEISLDILSQRRIRAEELITHTYHLAQVEEAFEAALNKEKTKAIKVQMVA